MEQLAQVPQRSEGVKGLRQKGERGHVICFKRSALPSAASPATCPVCGRFAQLPDRGQQLSGHLSGWWEEPSPLIILYVQCIRDFRGHYIDVHSTPICLNVTLTQT